MPHPPPLSGLDPAHVFRQRSLPRGLLPQDTEIACQNGVDGILVSNHGARQLDTCPATIEMLPEIVAAARGRCEVYLDGGVSRGLDALKALALGAKAVLIGRAYLWGLVHRFDACTPPGPVLDGV